MVACTSTTTTSKEGMTIYLRRRGIVPDWGADDGTTCSEHIGYFSDMGNALSVPCSKAWITVRTVKPFRYATFHFGAYDAEVKGKGDTITVSTLASYEHFPLAQAISTVQEKVDVTFIVIVTHAQAKLVETVPALGNHDT